MMILHGRLKRTTNTLEGIYQDHFLQRKCWNSGNVGKPHHCLVADDNLHCDQETEEEFNNLSCGLYFGNDTFGTWKHKGQNGIIGYVQLIGTITSLVDYS